MREEASVRLQATERIWPSDLPIVQVVVISLRAIGSVRRVGWAIVLPEDVHETEIEIQSAHHCDREEKKTCVVVIGEIS